jgi:hypothetical protein
MKRSNLIITIALFIAVSWFLISGWIQARAYILSKEGKPFSYVENLSKANVNQLRPFKNIKIEFHAHSIPPIISISHGKSCEIIFSNGITKVITYRIANDTLLINLNYVIDYKGDQIYIKVPELNNVTLKSDPEDKWKYLADWGRVMIYGFESKTLSVNNDCKFKLQLEGNKLRKLIVRGTFPNEGNAEIVNSQDYDTLDVDIQGKQGKISFLTNNRTTVMNPKQVVSIKAPSTFRVNAVAAMASKIIAKK